MPLPNGCEYAIYFDSVHIIAVNERDEARLFENGNSGKGRLLYKRGDPVAKVSVTDPFQLLNLAVHFVISYELLSQIADKDALKYFERIGTKEFLERVAEATTEEDRRNRFNGLGPKFSNFEKETKPPERRGRPPKAATTTDEAAKTPEEAVATK